MESVPPKVLIDEERAAGCVAKPGAANDGGSGHPDALGFGQHKLKIHDEIADGNGNGAGRCWSSQDDGCENEDDDRTCGGGTRLIDGSVARSRFRRTAYRPAGGEIGGKRV
jgi:hypothetical protein